MFARCSQLESIPILSATTIEWESYNGMFKGCIRLPSAKLLATGINANQAVGDMFNGCYSLSSIDVDFNSWTPPWGETASDPFSLWVSGVAANGTFTKPAALSTEFGPSKIPDGWTIYDK